MRNRNLFYAILALMILTLAGCAYHGRIEHATLAEPYGFFWGLWHGIIFPFSLATKIVSWIAAHFDFSFLKDVEVIGEPNSGGPYYSGFALGIIIIFNIFD
ncbi:MAG: hypothetical protein K2P92_01725 [Bdellovibrionaceae bacterium]|nr:hypothetical protein [Pseudobdellovibrionaceae bacterium]